jgi:type II secretory pathway pseudopilin PulG
LTLIEILVVVGVIAILVGMLVPAVNMVKNAAREVKQQAQFTAIGLGLEAFKNDYGEYPPSEWFDPDLGGAARRDYCGAQQLAEAMLGWDLMGFHPKSVWRADGYDADGGPMTYDPDRVRHVNGDGIPDTLEERRAPYIELEMANVFQLGWSGSNARDGLFPDLASNPAGELFWNTHVITDVFEVPGREVRILRPNVTGQVVAERRVPGTPILYYRADPSRKRLAFPTDTPWLNIYDVRDNIPLVSLGRLSDASKPLDMRRRHPIDPWAPGTDQYGPFYRYIRDPKVTQYNWPYRPDSYLLISAGPDGLYGTEDDVRNFGK